MLKDDILKILDINKELIKKMFSLDDDGIENIRKLFKKGENFKQVVDDIFLSDAGNREKMVAYYMIGYVNGERKGKMKN
jgi:hypothetical protein